MKSSLPVIIICLLTLLSGARAYAGEAADAGAVACPECSGEGVSVCPAQCKGGKVRCPATCLKKDDPGWVPGAEGKLWKHFPYKKADKQGVWSWSIGHVGELIVHEDGMPVNKGPCPTCKATNLADCKRCKGAGKQTCALCKGAKKVTATEAEAYAAKLAAEKKANTITLKDGRTLQGKVVGRTPDKLIVKTDDGKMETVDLKDVAESPAVK